MAFNVSFRQYEWNVTSFELKNSPFEFQKIMNDIFNPYVSFIIVYIDDVLVYSDNLERHFKYLTQFHKIAKHNGVVMSTKNDYCLN